MADSDDCILPVLPEWLTLTQAAEWLTGRTQAVGLTWAADTLLAILCTNVGPLSDIHESLPLWLFVGFADAHAVLPSGETRHIDDPYVQITPWTSRLFYVQSAIDSGMVEFRSGNGITATLCAGRTVLRDWLVVRGFDLIMFLNAYAHAQKEMQARITQPARDVPVAAMHVRDGAAPARQKSWQDAAREIADELYDRDTSAHVRNSLTGYAKQTMEEMQRRNIHGPRGSITNPATVQREALQGDKWWAKKQK
ncbi:hypothetical protein [Cupriavidus metallidurans]|uniref:hypothetical protein n=1 Tax=Cupriavidus metallidurans TaxID=119219 RepID=UPI00055E4410|nr:hypothetical protein [Cupriavidus metallidurans]